MDDPVETAIRFIWERFSEPVSLTEIADSALLSRFYFVRLFRQATGLTPGRFLTAVRIYQAKAMLLDTSASVTDISLAVGYNSLGSFTNHFTGSVGMPPGRFRRAALDGAICLPRPRRSSRPGHGAVAGTISLPDGHSAARVFMGAFATPIVQHPCAAVVVADVPGDRPCCYHLPDVPAGTWFIHAVGVAGSSFPDPWNRRTQLVGGHDPVVVAPDAVTSAAVRLRPGRLADPPVLLALPDLEPRPLSQLAEVTACAAVSPRLAVSPRPRAYS